MAPELGSIYMLRIFYVISVHPLHLWRRPCVDLAPSAVDMMFILMCCLWCLSSEASFQIGLSCQWGPSAVITSEGTSRSKWTIFITSQWTICMEINYMDGNRCAGWQPMMCSQGVINSEKKPLRICTQFFANNVMKHIGADSQLSNFPTSGGHVKH